MKSAHDVRHLCFCAACRGLADDREVINLQLDGACAFKLIGIEGLLRLPRKEQDKFTLADIGPKAMKRLVDTVAKENRTRAGRRSA